MEENNEQGKGCIGIAGGCLLKIIGFILLFIAMAFVKTCSKSMMRNNLKNSTQTEYVGEDKASIDAQLNRVMDQLRAELPKQIDEVTIQKDVQMDEKNFYYICDLDDSQTNFASLDNATLKAVQQKGLISILPGMREMIEVLIQTNRGLTYRYCGTTSGITRDITFTCHELQDLLSKV